MVPIEDLPGMIEFETVFRQHAPGYRGDPVKIIAGHTILCR